MSLLIASVSLLDKAKWPSNGTILTDLGEFWMEDKSQTMSENFETTIHMVIRSNVDDDTLSIAIINAADELCSDINRGIHDSKPLLHLAVINSNLNAVGFLLQNHSVTNL